MQAQSRTNLSRLSSTTRSTRAEENSSTVLLRKRALGPGSMPWRTGCQARETAACRPARSCSSSGIQSARRSMQPWTVTPLRALALTSSIGPAPTRRAHQSLAGVLPLRQSPASACTEPAAHRPCWPHSPLTRSTSSPVPSGRRCAHAARPDACSSSSRITRGANGARQPAATARGKPATTPARGADIPGDEVRGQSDSRFGTSRAKQPLATCGRTSALRAQERLSPPPPRHYVRPTPT
jgi:hypothetical protein